MTLWRAFRRDRLLAIGFVLLAVAGLLPLFFTPILPFIDWNKVTGHGAILWDVAFGDGVLAHHFRINTTPVPYWTGFIITAILASIGGVLFAAKAMVAMLIVGMPLAVMRLLVALKRDPRLGLWAFLLNYERNMWAGWIAYLLGMAMVLWTLAWLLEADTWKKALKATLMSALIAVTHSQALAYLAAAGLLLYLVQPSFKRAAIHTLGLSGGLVAVLPWLGDVAYKVSAKATTAKLSDSFLLDMHTPDERISSFYDYTFHVFAGEFTSWIPVLALVLLLAGPVLVASVGRPIRDARLAPALLIMLAAALLYAVLPFSLRAPDIFHKHNYVRYGSFILVGLLLVPRQRLRGRAALALAPGIVLALAMDWHTARHFSRFSPSVEPFLEIMAAVKPNSRLLPIIVQKDDPTCAMAPIGGLHGLLAADAHSFDPYFFGSKHVPITYRPGKGIRSPVFHGRRFDWDKDLRRYDYVWIQGLHGDPFIKDKGERPVKLVLEAGMWRLYEVVK
jgi:hypothetical protein